MNEILQLKGTFQQRPNENKPGPRNIPKNADGIDTQHLRTLLRDLEGLHVYWNGKDLVKGCLIDVHYIDVIAKSNRIKAFLSLNGAPANDSVVGARFRGEDKKKHVITHFVSGAVLDLTITRLKNVINLIDEVYSGAMSHDDISQLRTKEIDYAQFGILKTAFRNMVVDSHYIDGFRVPDNSANADSNSIITIYQTGADLIDLMNEIGIMVQPDKILSETTLLLLPEQIALLEQKAPYLIAMAVEDISNLSFKDIVNEDAEAPLITIGTPGNEPIIGVIDTMFDESVYFSEWVDFRKTINENIPLDDKDFVHGTSVSSIIVDGPAFNQRLDDGCGRFRVRHFGVMPHGPYSSFTIMKSIQNIVEQNPDIKVWNLSLGSDKEINPNSISPEAAILDKIQSDKDVIFIIAGTNKRDDETGVDKIIGSPADSINAIVVNSVNGDGDPASYTRKGLVLSFFNKPDVSSFGGDTGDYINVCDPRGLGKKNGTSFAAPWVTRKVAYLIEVLGLTREVAKALIVDAAAGWDNTGNNNALAPLVGHGVVPTHIDQILKTSEDEIKFVISGVSEKWDTYSYNLPVPVHNEKHPFAAKATLCYFPSCSINQGVDYTNTELDLHFGRVKNDGIKSINKNTQNVRDGVPHYIYEGNARLLYRKWDNTKHISDKYTSKSRAKDSYGNGMWGISVKTTERLRKRFGDGIKFGLVVTLKELSGSNRINEFVRQCELRGWLVTRVDVNSSVEIYNKAQEVVTLQP